MDDIKTQAAALIAEAPIPDDAKKTLAQKLEKEGVSDDFLVELQVAVGKAQAELNRKYKPQLDKLKELNQQEEAEQAKAFADFSKEMDELEKDADELAKAVSAGQDAQAIEEQRKKIAGK